MAASRPITRENSRRRRSHLAADRHSENRVAILANGNRTLRRFALCDYFLAVIDIDIASLNVEQLVEAD